jgi:hypothetical protein
VKSKVSVQSNHQAVASAVAKEVPYRNEADLVNAYTAVNRATTDREKPVASQELSILLRERKSTYVRWTFDRHVTRVKVLPRDTIIRPARAHFENKTVN